MEETEQMTFFKRHKLKVEVLGWIGSILILIPYMFSERLDNITDAVMNVSGASAVLVSCIPKKAWQPIILNSVWIITTIYNFSLQINET
jgi:hypothetical protein